MNRSVLFGLFFFFFTLYAATLYATDQYGFKDIPFGASFEEVYKKAKTIQYQSDKEQYNKRTTLKGLELKHWKMIETDNRMQLVALRSRKFIALINNQYNLGEIKVDVYFWFDHNDKFYSFDFSTKEASANYLESKVHVDGEYLSNVFKVRFGEPSKCYSPPNILIIKHGSATYLCKWKHRDLEIFTGITENNSKYYATGNVISKNMEKQYIEFKEQEKSKGAVKGAESF